MTQFRVNRRCVYCGNNSATDEDYFGRGVRKLLNPQDQKRRHKGSSVFELGPDGLPIITGGQWKSGAVVSGKLKIACVSCNGGWMSGLQSNVLPILKKRIKILDQFPPLDQKSRNALASWVAMVVMSYEWKHLPSKAVSQSERDFLRLHRKPPPNWSICLGRYSGCQETAISHFGLYESLLDDPKHIYLPNSGYTSSNAQCTTFVIGNLLFHAYSLALSPPLRQAEIDDMVQQFSLCVLTNSRLNDMAPERIHDDLSANAIAEFLVPPGPVQHRPMISMPPGAAYARSKKTCE